MYIIISSSSKDALILPLQFVYLDLIVSSCLIAPAKNSNTISNRYGESQRRFHDPSFSFCLKAKGNNQLVTTKKY